MDLEAFMLEPMFETKSFLGRERFISGSRLAEYKIGLCPTAEAIQPKNAV